jgi:F-type H+-transporting ATPase subunit b
VRRALVTIAAFGWLLGASAGLRAEEAEGHGAAAAETAREAESPGETSEHEEPHLDGAKLAWQIINFAALVAVLGWFGGRALSKALAARHEQLRNELAQAAEAKAAAEARLAKEEKRLAALEQEIAAMRAGIKQEAEAEKARLIELAEERAKRIKEETSFLLDQQVKEAEATLRRQAAESAVQLAEQIVRRTLNAGDQQRLLDGFVADVAGEGARAPGGAPRRVG